MFEKPSSTVDFFSLGSVEYRQSLELQSFLHKQVLDHQRPSLVLFLQHDPVISVGKHGDLTHVLIHAEERQNRGIDLVQTDRGGDVTAHEPGQLVVYPILDIQAMRLTPRSYVYKLEETVIRFLAAFEVQAKRIDGCAGVWVEQEKKNKIAAIGIRIAKRVSYHGLALNISNNFEVFDCIVPCGLRGRGVCSLSSLLRRSIKIEEVLECYIKIFAEVFGLREFNLYDEMKFSLPSS